MMKTMTIMKMSNDDDYQKDDDNDNGDDDDDEDEDDYCKDEDLHHTHIYTIHKPRRTNKQTSDPS